MELDLRYESAKYLFSVFGEIISKTIILIVHNPQHIINSFDGDCSENEKAPRMGG